MSRLAVLFSLVMAAGIARGDTFESVDDPTRAFRVRMDAIESASESIQLVYYAVEPDPMPLELLMSVGEAARRGVSVRIVFDGLKTRLSTQTVRALCTSGVQLRIYRPPHPLKPASLNRRLHVKMLLVDQQVAIIGSRNLEQAHFGGDTDRSFVDTDAVVRGKIAERAACYFEWLWKQPTLRPAHQVDWSDENDQASCQCTGGSVLKDLEWSEVAGSLSLRAEPEQTDVVRTDHLQLLYDRRPDKSDRTMQSTIIRWFDEARHRCVIESPYPAFARPVRRAIGRAARRGVEVVLFTNSLESTDQTAVYAAYQNQKRGLLRDGVQLREYTGDGILHSKTAVFDGRRSVIGSHNFDSRSDRLNFELCVISDDPAVAHKIRKSQNRRLQHSAIVRRQWFPLDTPSGHWDSKRWMMIGKRAYAEWIRRCL